MRYFLLSNLPPSRRSNAYSLEDKEIYACGQGKTASQPQEGCDGYGKYDYAFMIGVVDYRSSKLCESNINRVFFKNKVSLLSCLDSMIYQQIVIRINEKNINFQFMNPMHNIPYVNLREHNAIIVDIPLFACDASVRPYMIKHCCETLKRDTPEGTNIVLAYTYTQLESVCITDMIRDEIKQEINEQVRKFDLDCGIMVNQDDPSSVDALFSKVAQLLMSRLGPEENEFKSKQSEQHKKSTTGCQLM